MSTITINGKLSDNTFSVFKHLNQNQNKKTNRDYTESYRVKAYNRDISTSDKTKALVGSTIGTLGFLTYMMKKQKIKNPLKLKYGMWDMIGASAASIVGGVGFGLLGEDKEVKKTRLKEGVFQFMNAAIPAWVVGGVISLCENSEKHNNTKNKILSVVGGLLVGMYGSAALANIITDPKDKYPDRKLSYKDALANIDDAAGALALAKLPIISSLNIEKILPVVYTACGYRAGQSN